MSSCLDQLEVDIFNTHQNHNKHEILWTNHRDLRWTPPTSCCYLTVPPWVVSCRRISPRRDQMNWVHRTHSHAHAYNYLIQSQWNLAWCNWLNRPVFSRSKRRWFCTFVESWRKKWPLLFECVLPHSCCLDKKETRNYIIVIIIVIMILKVKMIIMILIEWWPFQLCNQYGFCSA